MIITIAISVPLLASLALFLTARRIGMVLPPAVAVPLLTAAALVCALATGFVLAVCGFVALARIPVVASLGRWSVPVIDAESTSPGPLGWIAVVVFAGMASGAVARLIVAVRGVLAAGRLGRQLDPHDAAVVVVDDDIADAYALPGHPGRVVVSTTMLRALSADERRALLAHESAHLRHGHHWYVQAARLAAAANLLLRPVADAVASGVERWADEVAAADLGDRRLVGTALARAGLARASSTRQQAQSAETLGAVTGDLVVRTQAMLADPPLLRRGVAAALIGVILVVVAAATGTERLVERQFELAQANYAIVHGHTR